MTETTLEDGDNLAPSPSRLVESLRDTGYSYQAAFADIVDNAIAANASAVEIDISQSVFGDDVLVAFYDNGSGMTEKSLKEAMRYGSEKRTSPKSLGKFGMGLKTASTAFCRKLTVISKVNGAFVSRRWDIDRIISEDKWVLLSPSLDEYAEQLSRLESVTGTGNGTAVIWENVDRLISSSGTDFSSQALQDLTKEIKDHLSATFGKFLIGREVFKDPAKTGQWSADVSIKVNGEKLIGWDPTGKFLNTSKNPDRVLIEKSEQSVTVNKGNSSHRAKFEFNGYVLPTKNKMTVSELEAVRFGNDNQGFYIYREDRLILGGGWPHRMFSQDSHLNLLRVELNFEHDLDDYFEIDIRKSKINLPIKIRHHLRDILSPWRNQASKRYRQNRPIDNSNLETNKHTESSRAIGRHKDRSDGIKIVEFDPNSSKLKVKNRFGETEINRAAVVEGTDIIVATVPSIDGGMLWDIDIAPNEQVVVVLNESHEFYHRFYQSKGVTPILLQAMDSIFWALANAELKSISPAAKHNFEELRFSLANSLKMLAKELPDAD